MKLDDLPVGWVMASNDELGEFVNGAAFKPADWGDEGVPIVRIQNLTNPTRQYNKTLRKVDDRYNLENGDILVSWSATLDVFIWSGHHAYVNQHIFKVIPSPNMNKRFIFYALKLTIAELLKSEHLHGTTMKHINRKPFLAHPVPIPPLNEQHRIAEKLDTLFARLEKGEEAVRAVQKSLTLYRQSVLKAAVSGALTADWRAERAGQLEHGDDLLKCILKKRREKWECRGKYKEPTVPDTSDLPDLPEEWVWASVDQIAMIMGGLTKNGKRKDLPLTRPMLRVANVYQNRLELDDIHQSGVTETELKRVTLETRDILVVEGNGSKDQIGRMAVWSDEIPNAVHQNHLIKIRLLEKTLAEFLVTWFQSVLGRKAVEKVASSTSGLYTLSISKISAMVVPLPSEDEVDAIMTQVGEAHSKVDVLERWCETELKRSASLRQSILKDAFSGKLVEQNPNDEPASELLARITAEKSTKAKPAKKTSMKKKTVRKTSA